MDLILLARRREIGITVMVGIHQLDTEDQIMRLGGRIFEKWSSPAEWVALHQAAGYRACYAPVDWDADDATVASYVKAAADADLLIAETGAWSNPISPTPEQREKAIEKNIRMLRLADRLGARCCVNITGSCDPDDWHGPHVDNFKSATFDRIVATIQQIIDAVQPTRTSYTLEMLGWALPDSAETYAALIEAIDRPAFAVHFDPVNLINSPRRFYDNAEVVRSITQQLGSHIRSVHLKDVTMAHNHLVHIDECRPGTGSLDFRTLLLKLDGLGDADLPLMLEHLPNAEEYRLAADHIRDVASAVGVSV